MPDWIGAGKSRTYEQFVFAELPDLQFMGERPLAGRVMEDRQGFRFRPEEKVTVSGCSQDKA
jgi:hypothetical protein